MNSQEEHLTNRTSPPDRKVAVSKKGMVATAHPGATRAGVAMLAAGGNAMDAAVAAAFALGVVEPAASGLGGQTMMLVRSASERKTLALDGSSRAPNRALPKSLSPEQLRGGYKAATVPSTPAVLDYALSRYGTLDLAKVLEPAIDLASDGYPVSELQHSLTVRELEPLRAGTAAETFLKSGREAYLPGEIFKQPALAWTLERLADKGVRTFYTGKVAALIAEDMEANDGLIRRDDLAQVPLPIERRPLTCRFRDWTVRTFPPPAGGRTLIEMLNILSHFPPEGTDPDTPAGAVLLAKVIQRAFFDRRDRPYDPNFYSQMQNRKMLSLNYANQVASEFGAPDELSGETTHLSVMDSFGNSVALTQSIERVYGSYSATPQLGFLYNNYMMAFEHRRMKHPYFMRPNAVPWASVAPTLVFRHRGRRPIIALGSPGSERIAPAVLQVLLRIGSMRPVEAVEAPRLHCSIKGVVSLEAERFSQETLQALEAEGFTLDPREAFSFYLGCVQMVSRHGKELTGVADPRRDGSAEGPKK